MAATLPAYQSAGKRHIGFLRTLTCLIRLLLPPSPSPPLDCGGLGCVWGCKMIDSRCPSMTAEKAAKQHVQELVPTLSARSTPVFFQGC